MTQRVSVLTEQVTAVQAKILKELLADGRKTETEIAKNNGAIFKRCLEVEV
jgi:DNA-binding Lrp family transcriptional regulator